MLTATCIGVLLVTRPTIQMNFYFKHVKESIVFFDLAGSKNVLENSVVAIRKWSSKTRFIALITSAE